MWTSIKIGINKLPHNHSSLIQNLRNTKGKMSLLARRSPFSVRFISTGKIFSSSLKKVVLLTTSLQYPKQN